MSRGPVGRTRGLDRLRARAAVESPALASGFGDIWMKYEQEDPARGTSDRRWTSQRCLQLFEEGLRSAASAQKSGELNTNSAAPAAALLAPSVCHLLHRCAAPLHRTRYGRATSARETGENKAARPQKQEAFPRALKKDAAAMAQAQSSL